MDWFRAILRGTGLVTGVAEILLSGLAAFLAVPKLVWSLRASRSSPWNFPGDPPIFDTLWLVGSGGFLFVAVSLALIAAGRGLRDPDSRRLVRALFIVRAVHLAGSLIGLAGIAERHTARWDAVRGALREHVARVEAATPESVRKLDLRSLRRIQNDIFGLPS